MKYIKLMKDDCVLVLQKQRNKNEELAVINLMNYMKLGKHISWNTLNTEY